MTSPTRSRRTRGLTLVEIALAAVVLAVVLLAAVGLMVRSHRELARSEDLVHFQGEATRVAEELARADFRELVRTVPVQGARPGAMWPAPLYELARNLPVHARIDGWLEPRGPHAALLTVEVRWSNQDAAGRGIQATARAHRLVVRHDASLDVPVRMVGGLHS